MEANVAWALAGTVVGALVAAAWFRNRQRGVEIRLDHDLGVARRELEEQVRRSSEERSVQDLILSSMQDGVLLFDEHGQTVFANEATEARLGSRPREVAALMPLGIRSAAERAARERETASALVEIGSPTRWLRIVTTPAGEEGAVLVTVRDVTDAWLADRVRRDFVANASHELKTPAASIQAAAETIRHAASDDAAAVPRFALQLEREAMRLSRIVADLLDLSRLESGSELLERVHIEALVRQQVEAHGDAAREAGLTLTVEVADTVPVLGSAQDLSLLVRNLLDNAIRYARRTGSVRITTTATDRDVILSVADDGIGIPTKDLPRIFERFYRVDRARSRETGGTGLGLAIVKHVAENHGGHVEVESELGRGTTFRVSLPRA
jgi:two-component system phosphate regulon sensor histidine kinase PhoR